MITKAISRRNVLRGLAAAPVLSSLSPFLPSAVVRAAEAPKRLLSIFHPLGFLESAFWPSADPSGYKLSAPMSPLDPWKSQLIFADGIVLHPSPDSGNEHGSGMLANFTGSTVRKDELGMPTTASYDHFIAEHLFAKEQTPHKYLALGVYSTNNDFAGDHCFYSGPGQFYVKDNDPASVFQTLFGKLSGGMIDNTALLRAKAEKKSIIDYVKGDLDRICRKVGAQEKIKCDAHLESIRGMERALAALDDGKTECSKPAAPPSSVEDTAKIIGAQSDMIAAAFACDQTRVISLTMGHSNGNLDPVPGFDLHGVTHAVGDSPKDPAPVEKHKVHDQFIATQFAQLLKKLDSYKEGNGSMLDNTLIVMCSDTTTRHGGPTAPGAHEHRRMTYLLAGGGNFAFKTGRHIKLANPNDPKKTSQHRLLTSVSKAFGRPVDKVGNFDPGSGPLPGL